MEHAATTRACNTRNQQQQQQHNMGGGDGSGGRQRARVGGPTLPASSSAGELTRSPAGSMQDPCSPISSPISAGSRMKPQQQQQGVPPPQQLQQHQFLQQPQRSSPRPASPIMVFRQEAPAAQQQSFSRVPTPPLLSAGQQSGGYGSHSGVPEPPAPRCWAPSKLSNGSAGGAGPSTPRCMTPAEALEQEMQELCCAGPGSPASGSMQRPHSCTPASSSMGPGGVRRPSSTGGSPHAAQHNNLVGAQLAGRPHSTGAVRADSWSSPLGLTKGLRDMKERLTGLGSDTSSTAVEAFAEPLCGPACSDASNPVVARRRGTAPARLQPSGATTGRRSAAQWEHECTQLLSIGDRLAVLQLPGPSNGVVRCYVKRTSNLLGMATLFELRLESTDELLAVAHKRVKSATSCYDISLSSGGSSSSAAGGSGSSTPSSGPSHLGGGAGGSSSGSSTLGSSALGSSKDSPQLVGKLKANLLGTEYWLRGRGGDYAVHKGFGAQLLAVNYKPTVNHIQAAPRTMSALLPLPGSLVWGGGRPVSSGGGGGQFDSLAACLDAARERQLPMTYERDLVMLHTMNPHFDAAKQVHYLDFKGRVTKVSGKNFQLVHWDHNANQLGTDLVLLFGKRGHGEFALDFSYPMTPLQAFALGLSSIDSKLCCAM